MATNNVLALAVASSRCGYVYLANGSLQEWGTTVRATQKPTDLAGFAQGLINDLAPDIVVTEKCDEVSKKGKRTKELIRVIAETASHNYLLDVSVPRLHTFTSKYEEAENLAKLHPELAGYVPRRKRRIFDFEPRGLMVFEALALARQVTATET